MQITIYNSELAAINTMFDKLDALAKKEAIKKLSDDVHERAIDYADKHTRTGAMMRSIQKKSIDGGYEIFSDKKLAPYAIFVHFGTRPHTIKPSNKKTLRYPNKSASFFRFAKEVHHTGYKGDPFLYNALQDEIPNFLKEMERRINDL